MKRIVSAIFMAFIFLFFLFYSNSEYFKFFWAFVTLSVVLEALNMININRWPEKCFFIVFATLEYFFFKIWFIDYLFIISITILILRSKDFKNSIQRLSSGYFLTHYSLLLLFANKIILQKGSIFFLSSISLIWFYDIFAYYFGCKYGKHKIAPSISPKKSYEGFIFGAIASIVASMILLGYFQKVDLFIAILFGSSAAILGHIGDIFESAWKRKADLKDSSDLIPGHGGVWDRVDGMVLLLPAYISILIIFAFSVN